MYAFGSTEFHVVRPIDGVLDPRYIHHFLRLPQVRSMGQVRMTGSAGQRRVPSNFVATLRVPLPSLAEQRRVAAILDSADALRKARDFALGAVDRLGHAAFRALIGDPVTNPMEWRTGVRLGDVADISSGITKGRRLREGETTSSVPYLSVANIQDKRLDLHEVKRIEATIGEVERFKLVPDDLLLTEGGDPDKLGRGTVWRGEIDGCIHQNHIFRVRVNDEQVSPMFLSWLLSSSRGKRYFLRSAKQTTGIASINMSQLKDFPLLSPPLAVQRRFEGQLKDVARAKELQLAARMELDALFASLQHRAFRGGL